LSTDPIYWCRNTGNLPQLEKEDFIMKIDFQGILSLRVKFRQIATGLLFVLSGTSVFALDCNHFNGIWTGQLDSFTNVQLVITSNGRSETKQGVIRYVNAQHQNKFFDVGFANCRQINNSLSMQFYTRGNGVEIYLTLIMNEPLVVKVPAFSVRENQNFEKVSGILIA
jgi:hypothetical protein